MGFLYHNFLSDLFGMSLNGLAGLVTEYAIAIILLTIFIRMALMPIDIKMRKNQRKMAELGPQMQSLQKRYANDPAQLQKKQRELYKKMGAQPLLGCLPMLLQLFILFAFFGAMRDLQSQQTVDSVLSAVRYGTANVDISSFIWVHNLWQPDTVFALTMPTANDFATFLQTNADFLSPQILYQLKDCGLVDFSGNVISIVQPTYSAIMNSISVEQGFVSENGNLLVNGACILPILSGVSLFLAQKFGGAATSGMTTGTEADQSMAGTNKIFMYVFPVFSAYICFTSNAAFALYWTVSSLYAFAQGRIIMNILNKKGGKDKKTKISPNVSVSNS